MSAFPPPRKIVYYSLGYLRHLVSRGVFVSDLVVMRKYLHLKIRRNLHSASCSFGRCRFHPYRSCLKAETHLHWLAQAGEMLAFDLFHPARHSDDHPGSFANWMMQNTYHHSLFETDPDLSDLADAVAVLASLLDVTAADAGQESAERLVDSPI